jgi:hypothetical protein
MEPSGNSIRESAGKWRSIGTLLVVLAGIGSLIFSVNAAQAASIFEQSDFDGQVFFFSLLISFGSAMVVIWPYFMFAQTMEAIGVLLDRSAGSSDTQPVESSRPRIARELVREPAPAAPPAKQLSEQPSQRELDILEYLGKAGPAGAPEIREGIGLHFGVVEALNDLVARGLVAQSEGRYDRVGDVNPEISSPTGETPSPAASPVMTKDAATVTVPAAGSTSSQEVERVALAGLCDSCGATLKKGHRFCSACGKAVSGQ